ncbi:Cyclic di-GMP phosphodiesterase PdeB [bacterium HR11]|nr:Cyclic di-GMP phosphodiesterase PdeB [bacterium HR11]
MRHRRGRAVEGGLLDELAAQVDRGLDLEALAQAVLEVLVRRTGSVGGWVCVNTPTPGRWQVVARQGPVTPGACCRSQEAAWPGGPACAFRAAEGNGPPLQAMEIPLHSGGSLIGVVRLYGRERRQPRLSAETRTFLQGWLGAVLAGVAEVTALRGLYRQLFERLPVGIYRSTPEGRIITANPAAVRMFGYEREEEFCALNATQLYVDPEDRRRWLQMLQEQGEVLDFVAPMRRKDGQVLWVRDSARAIRDAAGQVVYLEGVLEDVTAARQAEEALQESEARYRRLVELSPEGVGVHLDGRLVYVNPAGARILGAASPEEIIGRPVADFVHPDYRALVEERIRRMLTVGGSVELIEEKFVRLDGQVIDVEVAATAIPYRGRTAVMVVVRDVTERKRAEAERSRLLDRMKAQQAALVRLATEPALAEGRLDDLWPVLTATVADVLGVERVNVWEFSPDGSELRCRMGFERTARRHSAGDVLPMYRYPRYLEALQSGLVIEAPDVHQDPRTAELTADYWAPLGIASSLDAPIRLRGRVVGVLCCEHVGTPRTWAPDEVAFVTEVADLIAQAFLNAEVRRLAEEVQKRADRAIRLHRASEALSVPRPFPMTAEVIGREAARLADTDRVAVYLVHPDGTVTCAWSQGVSEAWTRHAVRWYGQRVGSTAGTEPLWASFETGWPAETFPAAARREGVRSMAVWPVVYEARTRAFIECVYDRDRSWSDDERELMQAYTRQAAIALENARLMTELQQRAILDPLTGVYNRRYLEDALERALASVRRGAGPHALLYIDLDKFKVVNDVLGHFAGDNVLRDLAQHLLQRTRKSDLLARVGGDEFAVLVYHRDVAAAEQAAEGFRQAVEGYRFQTGSYEFRFTASIGVAPITPDVATVADVLMRADLACYVAKMSGRNRVHRYTPDDVRWSHRVMDEVRRVQQVREALQQGRMALVFQPVVQLSTGTPVFYEALVRMVRDDGTLVAAQEFLPLAERYDFIHEVDRWVLARLLEAVHRWSSPWGLSVNVSGALFGDPAGLELVERLIQQWGASGRLIVEIPESVLLQRAPHAQSLIRKWREMGSRWALDGFGGPLSLLESLQSTPFDYVKVDVRPLAALNWTPPGRAAVEAICRVAQALGLKVVAKGVEDERTAAVLREVGVDYAQGFLWGRPQPL